MRKRLEVIEASTRLSSFLSRCTIEHCAAIILVQCERLESRDASNGGVNIKSFLVVALVEPNMK